LHNNAGVHALRAGDFPAAREHLDAACLAKQAIGEEDSHVLVNLGWVLRHDGDLDAARSRFESALRISRRNGERSGLAYPALGLACLAADRGEWPLAAVLHGVAQALLDRTGEPWQEPEASYRLESLDQVRAHHDLEAYARGLALSFDDALDLVVACGAGRSRRKTVSNSEYGPIR
jgi:tetratricopeptide (TPR) repeat protein